MSRESGVGSQEFVVEFGSRLFVGLDLGQARDHTAIAVVERRVAAGPRCRVTWELARVVSLELRKAERLAQGMPYPAVVDLLRASGPRCRVVPVVITGGEAEGYSNGYYRAPRRDLLVGLQVAVQWQELAISAGLRDAAALLREMRELRLRVEEGVGSGCRAGSMMIWCLRRRWGYGGRGGWRRCAARWGGGGWCDGGQPCSATRAGVPLCGGQLEAEVPARRS